MRQLRIIALRLWGTFAFVVAGAFAQSASTTNQDDWLRPTQSFNEQLPYWLRFSGQYRSRWEAKDGLSFSTGDDGYLLSRLWVGMQIRPTKWLTIFGQTQDARVFANNLIPSKPPYQNTFDIHQAYVRIGQRETGWADLEVGRQELALGSSRLIGVSHWLNTPRVFDAVRLGLHRDGVRVDLFSSSVVQNRDGVIDHHSQGDNVHGVFGSFYNVIPKAALEPYFFWRLESARFTPTEISKSGHLDEKTFGFRLIGSLPAHWDYETEMVKQLGSLGNNSIQAWAGYWTIGRRFEDMAGKPRPYIQYNYASGDNNPSDRTNGTFDQLYPSAHDRMGLADLIGWRNVRNLQVGLFLEQNRRWSWKFVYHNNWLATNRDGLYTASGALVVRPAMRDVSRYIGAELDAQANYRWNSALDFGVGYAHLFTGMFLNQTTDGKDFNYPYVVATYSF